MRKLWCLEVEKIWEKIINGISQFFFLENKWRELERFKKNGKKGKIVQTNEAFQTCPRVVSVCHTWSERDSGRVAHVASLLGLWPSKLPRAPLAFFSRIRASKLRIRIPFWITNHDSLTHNEDYETLTNGLEFISENDDEHNSTNENAK